MKNRLLYGIVTLFFVATLYACKKEKWDGVDATSLTVLNVIDGGQPMIPHFEIDKPLFYFRTAAQIAPDASVEINGYTGLVHTDFFNVSDTLHAIIQQDVRFDPGSIQTLVLTGTASKPESVLFGENIPVYAPADSLIGIRFANFSPGSSAIKIKIDHGDFAVGALPYKAFSEFKSLSIQSKSVMAGYTFEVRDVVSNSIVADYQLSAEDLKVLWSKNVTLALAGLPGNQHLVRVNHF